jgi:hypothetical protein
VIAEAAADIMAKVRTVSGLEINTSLTVGAKSGDPGLVKIPLPAAWIVFGKEINDDQSYTHGPAHGVISAQPTLALFAVTIFMPYTTDAEMLATQYPMLDAVVAAVHATAFAPTVVEDESKFYWRFAGQSAVFRYADKLAYEQHYTLSFVRSPPLT